MPFLRTLLAALFCAALPGFAAAQNDERMCAVQIGADGSVVIAGRVASESELERRFAELAAKQGCQAVHLIPDAQASYESIDKVAAAARKAGMTAGIVGNWRNE